MDPSIPGRLPFFQHPWLTLPSLRAVEQYIVQLLLLLDLLLPLNGLLLGLQEANNIRTPSFQVECVFSGCKLLHTRQSWSPYIDPRPIQQDVRSFSPLLFLSVWNERRKKERTNERTSGEMNGPLPGHLRIYVWLSQRSVLLYYGDLLPLIVRWTLSVPCCQLEWPRWRSKGEEIRPFVGVPYSLDVLGVETRLPTSATPTITHSALGKRERAASCWWRIWRSNSVVVVDLLKLGRREEKKKIRKLRGKKPEERGAPLHLSYCYPRRDWLAEWVSQLVSEWECASFSFPSSLPEKSHFLQWLPSAWCWILKIQ